MNDKKTIIIFILSLVGAFFLGGIIGFLFHSCSMQNFRPMSENMMRGHMMQYMNQTGRDNRLNENTPPAQNEQSIEPQESRPQDTQNPLQETTK